MEESKITLNFFNYKKQIQVKKVDTLQELENLASSFIPGSAFMLSYVNNGVPIDILNDGNLKKALQAIPNNLIIDVEDTSTIIDISKFKEPPQQVQNFQTPKEEPKQTPFEKPQQAIKEETNKNIKEEVKQEDQNTMTLNFVDYNRQVKVKYAKSFKELEDLVKSCISKVAFQLSYEFNYQKFDILNENQFQKAVQQNPKNLVVAIEEISDQINPSNFKDPSQQENQIKEPQKLIPQNSNLNVQQNPWPNNFNSNQDQQVYFQQNTQPGTKSSQEKNIKISNEQVSQSRELKKQDQNIQQQMASTYGANYDVFVSHFRLKVREQFYGLMDNQDFINILADNLSKRIKPQIQQEIRKSQNQIVSKLENVGQITEIIETPSFIFPVNPFNLILKIKNTGLNSWKLGQAFIKCEQIPQLNQAIDQEVNPEQTVEKQYQGIQAPQLQPQNQAQQNTQIDLKFTLEIQNKEVAQLVKKINIYFPLFQIITPQVQMNQGLAVLSFKNLNTFDWPQGVGLYNQESKSFIQFPIVQKQQDFQLNFDGRALQILNGQGLNFIFVFQNQAFGSKFQIQFFPNMQGFPIDMVRT